MGQSTRKGRESKRARFSDHSLRAVPPTIQIASSGKTSTSGRDDRTHYIDGPTEAIGSALTPEIMRDAMRYAMRVLQPCIDEAVLKQASGAQTCSDEVAVRVFDTAIYAATRIVSSECNGYSSLRWLWLLRRLPDWVFEGYYTTTHGYDTGLAETIAGAATGRSRGQLLDDCQWAYPIDATVVRRLARHCACSIFLSELHQNYRWAGKGATFEFRRGQMPDRVRDDALQTSVYLYDERVEKFGGGRMGTEVFVPTVDLRELLGTSDKDLFSGIFIWCPVRQAKEVLVPLVDAEVGDGKLLTATIRPRHMFAPISLASIQALIDDVPNGQTIFDKHAAALLFLLAASMLHVFAHRAGLKSISQTGYLLLREEMFRARMFDAFGVMPKPIRQILDSASVTSAGEAVELLGTMAGRAWPLESGPILHRDGEILAVDLIAASRRASTMVYPNRQGALANVRSAHFELRVQAAIDSSRYAPPSDIGLLRGRTLRRHGQNITDLDAIARVGDSLLLISCKSIIYSPEYDVGEYRSVRNAAERVALGVKKWRDILTALGENPVGDNFDLSGWNFLGVVCTPNVVWTQVGPCTNFVLSGLRAAVSLAELQAWLESKV